MNPLVASVIRTYTPIIAGQVGAWLIMVNIPVLPDLTILLTAAVGGALSLAYYTLVRVLEQQWPSVGILLGLPKSPDTYTKGEPASAPAVPEVAAPVDGLVSASYVRPRVVAPADAATVFPAAKVEAATAEPVATEPVPVPTI